MTTFLLVLAVLYFAIGLGVYLFTDVSKFAHTIERKLVAVPLGTINDNLFWFVVLLWPLWLFVNSTAND